MEIKLIFFILIPIIILIAFGVWGFIEADRISKTIDEQQQFLDMSYNCFISVLEKAEQENRTSITQEEKCSCFSLQKAFIENSKYLKNVYSDLLDKMGEEEC